MGFNESSRIHGLFARSWSIGTTALWIAILLSAYTLAYFV
jgi:multicomponent Na+:H+ antiporter subunit D